MPRLSVGDVLTVSNHKCFVRIAKYVESKYGVQVYDCDVVLKSAENKIDLFEIKVPFVFLNGKFYAGVNCLNLDINTNGYIGNMSLEDVKKLFNMEKL